ncbi:IS630 transposase-related protein [Holospora curviuscula]|uniref:Transposase n=1 Tax=Holospora curviuscula TaxID=1082868 RepID=A0A2S5R7D0_9PROT|nr:IS630 transposase-related protein [Holospora curviuscula]PPE03197.1 Transposase [Holospora curviuscula]
MKKLSKESIRNDIEEFPDSDPRESSEKLGISESGIQYSIKPLGVTYKKTLHPAKADLEKRFMFCQRIKLREKNGYLLGRKYITPQKKRRPQRSD